VRPLIAVTGRPTGPGRPWRLSGFGSQDNYLDALERAGALGAVLQPVEAPEQDVGHRLDRFDGLLLTGGPDVDPARYGQERHPTVEGDVPRVDHFELALARAAIHRSLPLLAVCRGLQVLNVALAGTLHQHIGDLPGGSDHGRPGVSGTRTAVRVEPGSLLAEVMASTEAKTSCFHHQAVDRVGRGLHVTARAPDGVVEALELADRSSGGWLLAVQWHPETVAGAEPDQQRIFDAFSAAASAARA